MRQFSVLYNRYTYGQNPLPAFTAMLEQFQLTPLDFAVLKEVSCGCYSSSFRIYEWVYGEATNNFSYTNLVDENTLKPEAFDGCCSDLLKRGFIESLAEDLLIDDVNTQQKTLFKTRYPAGTLLLTALGMSTFQSLYEVYQGYSVRELGVWCGDGVCRVYYSCFPPNGLPRIPRTLADKPIRWGQWQLCWRDRIAIDCKVYPYCYVAECAMSGEAESSD